MGATVGVEKRIIAAAGVFVLALSGIIALTVRLFGIGLPTCLTDVRPFREAAVIEQAPKRYEIHYVAKMWKFEPDDIAVLPGSVVDIYLSTADVTHGLQIIGTNVNIMAVPGAVNFARVKLDEPGEYLVVCNEYCGVAHHNMAAKIRVTEDARPPAPPPTPAELAGGAKLLDDYGCTACHSTDGSESLGGSLKGLYGQPRTLADGSTVTADEAYLRESLLNPEAKVVKGLDPIMPPAEIPPADLDAILAHLRTLR